MPALTPDLVQSNWYSFTHPTARFTNQFFCCCIIDSERHHILNGEYVIREMGGQVIKKEKIEGKDRLLALVTETFGLTLPEDTAGLDRFLVG